MITPPRNILPSYFVMPILKRPVIPGDAETVIIKQVCERYDTNLEELRSSTRHRDIVFARHLCMFLLHRKTELSYKRIARIFGRDDHSTAIHAVNAIEDYMTTNSFGKREEIVTMLSTIHVNMNQQRA